jgi:hypothetical protein
MDVREAVEGDADRLSDIADTPTDAVVNLIHDRSVRVAVDLADAGPNADAGDDSETVLGFVSFDAREDAVHVTQLSGTSAACERLLQEPLRFARGEGMSVELLVPDDETGTCDAAEAVGFERQGAGPRFEGQETVRYRLDP